MFFSLTNASATFQYMMNNVFTDLIAEGWVVIYMDDILIFSQTLPELRERTIRVFECLHQNDLFLKLEKCTFETKQIDFLGLVLMPGHVHIDPVKVKGLEEWPTPTNIKEV